MSGKPHVVVALSGGVDSSVTAHLLKEQGYSISALFMQNWEEEGPDNDGHCSVAQDLKDAQKICEQLKIELHTVNFSSEYWDRVFSYFLSEYRAGRTPNPDILCNREIKFKAFLDYAFRLGADMMATGHYARCLQKDNHYQLLKGCDNNKDQTYFLYALNQKALASVLFPVGELPKTTVRNIAKAQGLITQSKKDSTGICFIGERKFKQFLEQYLPAQPGKMEDLQGNVIGNHDGLMYYTRGQRQGLGIGGQQGHSEAPWYVLHKDLSRNVLIVGQGDQNNELLSGSLRFNQATWIAGQSPDFPLHCQAKIRHRQPDQACTVHRITEDQFEARFEQPQRAVTPGQSIVLYADENCLGGGIITDYESSYTP